MPTCSCCGKVVSTGYTIIRSRIFCSECSEKLDDIIDEVLSRCIEEYITKHTIPNLDEELKKFEKTINELKLSKSFIKAIVLTRLTTLIYGRR